VCEGWRGARCAVEYWLGLVVKGNRGSRSEVDVVGGGGFCCGWTGVSWNGSREWVLVAGLGGW